MAHLGIDIGGTKVAFRGVLSDGEVRDSVVRWPASLAVSEDVGVLVDQVTAFVTGWIEPITDVGVAMPGTVGADGLVVAWPNRPHWVGLDFEALLRRLFPGARVRHGDDGALAALAEAEAASSRDLVYLGIGTGVGGGRVAEGRCASACEIGHMIIDRYGERCVCGRTGCVQAVASGPATLSRAARRRGSAVDLAELRLGMERRQSWAVSAVDDGCVALAIAIANVVEVLHPEVVVIGGGFAAAVDGFAGRVAAHVGTLARPGVGGTVISAAAHGGMSSLQGAVILASTR